MVAPDTWGTPTAGSTITPTAISRAGVSYAGGYWFAVTVGTGVSDRVKIRYATDPTGTWSEATLPAQPIGYTSAEFPDFQYAVVSDGTSYATLVRYSDGVGGFRYRVIHCTNPAGTWSSKEYDTGNTYNGISMHYGNGLWVIVGRYTGSAPDSAFIATCATVDGTYTFYSSASETGYDTTGGIDWDLYGIWWDGSTWVSAGYDNLAGTGHLRYSSSLTSGWAAPSSATIDGTPLGLRKHSGGYWSVIDSQDGSLLYATDPTGTWGDIPDTDLLTTFTTWQVAYGGGYWVAAGSKSVSSQRDPVVAYLSGASPSGTYTAATGANLTDPAATSVQALAVAASTGHLVLCSSYQGELRYFTLPATGPSLLRQRQSETRTPSRVRGVDLRQRQTPYIR